MEGGLGGEGEGSGVSGKAGGKGEGRFSEEGDCVCVCVCGIVSVNVCAIPYSAYILQVQIFAIVANLMPLAKIFQYKF